MIFSQILANNEIIAKLQIKQQDSMDAIISDFDQMKNYFTFNVMRINKKRLIELEKEIESFYLLLRSQYKTNKSLTDEDKAKLVYMIQETRTIRDSCLELMQKFADSESAR